MILTLMLLFSVSDARTPAHPPVLACELPYLTLAPGDTVEVYGRMQSWVGPCLTLDEATDCLVLASRSGSAVLASPDLRQLPLLLRVVRGEDQGLATYLVLEVEPGGPLEDVARNRLAAVSHNRSRQQAVLRWCLRTGKELARADLRALADEHLRAQVDLIVQAANAPEPEILQGILDLLRSSGLDSQLVLTLAKRWGNRPNLHAPLASVGLVLVNGHWQTQEDRFGALGLRQRGGQLVPWEKALLEEQLTQGPLPSRQLRVALPQEYRRRAEVGELAAGMTREEVVQAVGYPQRVTWLRREERLFEAWIYDATRWACLADGHLFRWAEER